MVDRWHIINRKRVEVQLSNIFQLMRARSVEPILIKGWAAARHYPIDVPRNLGDIDLAVAPFEYPRTLKFVGAGAFSGFAIDLHEGLRHLDTLNWDDLYRRSGTVELEGTPIRILAPEDHLRVLAVHWLNDGGAYKEKLWDIYYAVSNRPPDFDWDRCLNAVSKTRRRWIICAIGLAHRYLDLKIDDLSFADEARELPKWLIRTVEGEWESDVRLRPLQTCLKDPAELLRQIKKRFPPNPVQATVEVEGEFDDGGRAVYQVKDIVKRAAPSIRRIASELFRK